MDDVAVEAAVEELQELMAMAERSDTTPAAREALSQRLHSLERALLSRQGSTRQPSHTPYSARDDEHSPSPRRMEQSPVRGGSRDHRDKFRDAILDGAYDAPRLPSIRESLARAESLMNSASNKRVVQLHPVSHMGSSGNSNSSGGISAATMHWNFSQQFAQDDRSRLVFVIDAVTNRLQAERASRELLQDNVVPALVRRIEYLEALTSAQSSILKRYQSTVDEKSEALAHFSRGGNVVSAFMQDQEQRLQSLKQQCSLLLECVSSGINSSMVNR